MQGLVKYIRAVSPAHLYATTMSPPAIQQVISALKVTMGKDGTNRGVYLYIFNTKNLLDSNPFIFPSGGRIRNLNC